MCLEETAAELEKLLIERMQSVDAAARCNLCYLGARGMFCRSLWE